MFDPWIQEQVAAEAAKRQLVEQQLALEMAARQREHSDTDARRKDLVAKIEQAEAQVSASQQQAAAAMERAEKIAKALEDARDAVKVI